MTYKIEIFYGNTISKRFGKDSKSFVVEFLS